LATITQKFKGYFLGHYTILSQVYNVLEIVYVFKYVKVSKHDGIRLSKAKAMHPNTCPMNFGCNKIKIHK
jgi:hypothetical protein